MGIPDIFLITVQQVGKKVQGFVESINLLLSVSNQTRFIIQHCCKVKSTLPVIKSFVFKHRSKSTIFFPRDLR